MTQKLPNIPPEVTLDETFSTSGKKNSIGHLTSSGISIKFDADKTPEKPTLICLFRKGLKFQMG